MSNVHDMQQKTDEWLAVRAGKATASRFADVLAKSKKDGKPLKARQDYAWQLAVERLNGKPVQSIDAAALRWGRDNEPLAREAYEKLTGLTVEEHGFVEHGVLDAGCSPDGVVGDGLIEIKCPWSWSGHLETLLGGMPEDHIPQIQGQMWLTGKQWCDFISFDPRTPIGIQLYVQRIPRDEQFIEMLSDDVMRFLGEVDEIVKAIKLKFPNLG